MWEGFIVNAKKLMNSFDVSCQVRKFTRKRLLRFIRLNYHHLKGEWDYGWLSRKIELNYMKDITDDDVLKFVRHILKKTGGE